MKQGIVCVPFAPLTKKPMVATELADEVLHGTMVLCISEQEGYYYVKTSYGYEGFMQKRHVNCSKHMVAKWNKEVSFVIMHNFVDVLSAPKFQGYLLATLVRGSVLIKAEKPTENGFDSIVLANGTVGYVRSAFFGKKRPEFASQTETHFRNQVAKTALLYAKTPYRWGGKSPQGIDCSGLCFMAYWLNGLSIYRDASIKEGFPVSEIPKERLQKADLLFFPGHVALYLGNGLFVHSSSKSDGVYIHSLEENHPLYREDLKHTLLACGSVF